MKRVASIERDHWSGGDSEPRSLGSARCPQAKIHMAAYSAAVPEAMPSAPRTNGKTVTRLFGVWDELLQGLACLGPVMAQTQNKHAALQNTGGFRQVQIMGSTGLVRGDGLELRLFLERWHHGFAVEECTATGTQCSLQFFDADGDLLHQVQLTEQSNFDAFRSIRSVYADVNGSPSREGLQRPLGSDLRRCGALVAEVSERWTDLLDPQGLPPMLRGLAFIQTPAMGRGGTYRARPIARQSVLAILAQAADKAIPLMALVASPGVVQGYQGLIRDVQQEGRWLQLIGPGLNLRLRTNAIDTLWLVASATSDQEVFSIELYDRKGGHIALLLGKPEAKHLATHWHDLVRSVESLPL